MGLRRRGREHALKMLYQADIAGLGADETIAAHWLHDDERDAAARAFAERLVRLVLADRGEIDRLISEASHRWPLARISVVDRSILRLAIGELRGEPQTPAPVVIDEAVEIAHEYGDAETHVFVNGILETVRRRLAGTASSLARPKAAGDGDP